MQSGISGKSSSNIIPGPALTLSIVTPELHDAFTTFTTDSALFCLPVTITNESLTPQSAVPFANGSNANAFTASLPQLSPLLEPKTPLYLLLRRSPAGTAPLIALTYIPSDAPVRAKTLFASTRATLVRELGSEKFDSTVFATEVDEVVSAEAWSDRDAEKKSNSGIGSNGGGIAREDLMGDKERELEAVRRAVEEARSGTPNRDIGIGGSFNRGGNNGGTLAASSSGGGGMRIQMPMEEDASAAISGLQQGGLVQLVRLRHWLWMCCNVLMLFIQAIDIPTETLKLSALESSVDPDSVGSHVSTSSPRYAFYHYPESDVVIFIYTCPSGSSIKERMLYASSRANVIITAENQGLKISKKVCCQARAPTTLTATRSRGLRQTRSPEQD